MIAPLLIRIASLSSGEQRVNRGEVSFLGHELRGELRGIGRAEDLLDGALVEGEELVGERDAIGVPGDLEVASGAVEVEDDGLNRLAPLEDSLHLQKRDGRLARLESRRDPGMGGCGRGRDGHPTAS